MAHTYHSLNIHYVFGTKWDRHTLTQSMRSRIWPYMGGIARDNGMKALCVGGTGNHIHALISIPPTLQVSKAIQTIKGGSSKWIGDTFPSGNFRGWQQGYGAFTVSASGVSRLVRYIRNQAEHHRQMSYDEERLVLLEQHDLEHDNGVPSTGIGDI